MNYAPGVVTAVLYCGVPYKNQIKDLSQPEGTEKKLKECILLDLKFFFYKSFYSWCMMLFFCIMVFLAQEPLHIPPAITYSPSETHPSS